MGSPATDRTAARDRSAVGDEEMVAGEFRAQPSRFRRWIGGAGELPAEAARYHLYVARSCPFSHRTLIAYTLKGLDEVVGVSFLDPYRDARGWRFSGGGYIDDANGFEYLAQAYERTDPAFAGRVTVPVLWDSRTQQIVSNDSGDIMRMLGRAFDAVGARPLDLCPTNLRSEIDALNRGIHDNLNEGVYRAGFATDQAAYGRAFDDVFATLDWLDALLEDRRYLTGARPTEADWRLFATLVRFDAVYYGLMRCNARRLVDYPSLWSYARDLYQQPGIAATVAMDEIKRHYYLTLTELNPGRIIPRGPLDIAFSAPHGRSSS